MIFFNQGMITLVSVWFWKEEEKLEPFWTKLSEESSWFIALCFQKGISGNTSYVQIFKPLFHFFSHEYTKLEVCTILFQVGNQYAAENEDELKDKIDFEEKPGYRLRTGICQVNHELLSTAHPSATIFCRPDKSLHLELRSVLPLSSRDVT